MKTLQCNFQDLVSQGSTFLNLVSGHPQALLMYLQKMSSHCFIFLNCLQKEMLQVCDIHVISFLYLPAWQTLHHHPRGLILQATFYYVMKSILLYFCHLKNIFSAICSCFFSILIYIAGIFEYMIRTWWCPCKLELQMHIFTFA